MPIPNFLQAAGMYQSPNVGVLQGFTKGASGILSALNQKKELQLKEQDQSLRQQLDLSKQQLDDMYKNASLELQRQGLDIDRQKLAAELAARTTITPYQQAQLNLEQQRINKEGAITPYQQAMIEIELSKMKGTTPEGKAMEEFNRADSKEFVKSAKQAATSSGYAQRAIQDVDVFLENFKKLPAYTIGLAHKKFPDTAQVVAYSNPNTKASFDEAVKNASDLNLNLQNMQKTGKMTNFLAQIIQKGTLSMDMSHDGANKLGSQIKANALQQKQLPLLYGALKDSGIYSDVKANEIWDKYTSDYPILDEKGEPQLQNLDKWKKVMKESISGDENLGEETYKDTSMSDKSTNQLDGKLKEGKVLVKNPNGQLGYIPVDRLNEAIKAGYTRG